MYTSDNENENTSVYENVNENENENRHVLLAYKESYVLRRQGFNYLLAAIFTGVLGAVYEHFSHEVYSYYMLYAFAIPLVCGVLVCYILDMAGRNVMPSPVITHMYAFGIATLTVGSVMQGVLEIYGTTNKLVAVYPIVGLVLATGAALMYLVAAGRYRRSMERPQQGEV